MTNLPYNRLPCDRIRREIYEEMPKDRSKRIWLTKKIRRLDHIKGRDLSAFTTKQLFDILVSLTKLKDRK